ncbi:hypothetical protein [Cytobacillus pseudoceanisediminis]|uniref:hypothetical protein n=1 Tax=Cytobacillus pseudoceanisediminis TaxID=3051614 RepID=UPI0001F44AD1|nr:hypothetical protein HMPREF1013_04811 [Bacillus sp. 2_A_57_CT2]
MEYLQRVNDQIASISGQEETYSQRMYLIELMFYGHAKKLKDVDFSTFTLSELRDAATDILEYEPDETADPVYGEGANIGNPIYEINSLAGITKEVLSLEPKRVKKRRFF